MRSVAVVICGDGDDLGFGGSVSELKVGRKAASGSDELNGVALKAEDAEMGGAIGLEMNLIVGGGAERIVARLEPLEAGEREPAGGLLQVGGMLGAPGGEVAIQSGVLGENGSGQKN